MSNPTVSNILHAARRVLDIQAFTIQQFYHECDHEGHHGNETQRLYQYAYNEMVDLREKLTEPYLPDALKWDGPEAVDKIYLDDKP